MAEGAGRSYLPGNDVKYHPIHLHNFSKPALLQPGKTEGKAGKSEKVKGHKMPGWESGKYTLAKKGKKGKNYPDSR